MATNGADKGVGASEGLVGGVVEGGQGQDRGRKVWTERSMDGICGRNVAWALARACVMYSKHEEWYSKQSALSAIKRTRERLSLYKS